MASPWWGVLLLCFEFHPPFSPLEKALRQLFTLYLSHYWEHPIPSPSYFFKLRSNLHRVNKSQGYRSMKFYMHSSSPPGHFRRSTNSQPHTPQSTACEVWLTCWTQQSGPQWVWAFGPSKTTQVYFALPWWVPPKGSTSGGVRMCFLPLYTAFWSVSFGQQTNQILSKGIFPNLLKCSQRTIFLKAIGTAFPCSWWRQRFVLLFKAGIRTPFSSSCPPSCAQSPLNTEAARPRDLPIWLLSALAWLLDSQEGTFLHLRWVQTVGMAPPSPWSLQV